MNAGLHGAGGLTEQKAPNNNLTEESALLVKQMMSMILGIEFFRENKEVLFAKDIVIEDSSSKRKFIFTLDAKEIN